MRNAVTCLTTAFTWSFGYLWFFNYCLQNNQDVSAIDLQKKLHLLSTSFDWGDSAMSYSFPRNHVQGTLDSIAWENSQQFTTPPLVSPQNEVWETNTEISNWWHITTQIRVVLLIGYKSLVKFTSTNQKHYPDLASDVSSVWNFCGHFSDVILRGNHWWHSKMLAVFLGYEFHRFRALGSHQFSLEQSLENILSY